MVLKLAFFLDESLNDPAFADKIFKLGKICFERFGFGILRLIRNLVTFLAARVNLGVLRVSLVLKPAQYNTAWILRLRHRRQKKSHIQIPLYNSFLINIQVSNTLTCY